MKEDREGTMHALISEGPHEQQGGVLC